MNLSDLVQEPYSRRARLYPALVSVLPMFVIPALLYPGIETRAAALLTLVAYLGGAMWLTQVGRERGKRLEPGLFESWGGKPSVALLRHDDPNLSAATKKRYLAFLKDKVSQFDPPSADEERVHPERSNEMYQSATDWLLAKTRDTNKFRLLFDENVNYGFRRNLWALKPVALFVDSVLALAIIVHAAWSYLSSGFAELPDTPMVVALIAVVAHLLATTFLVTREWVKTTAYAYARQLLAACDSL